MILGWINRFFNYLMDIPNEPTKLQEEFKSLLLQAKKNPNNKLDYLIGYHIEVGIGVRIDKENARSWYRQALKNNSFEALANQGDKEAQFILGRIYDRGQLPDGHYDVSSRQEHLGWYWLRKAAEQSYAPAQNYVAFLYDENGNFHEARNWYELAANQGFAPAQYNTAIRVYNGL